MQTVFIFLINVTHTHNKKKKEKMKMKKNEKKLNHIDYNFEDNFLVMHFKCNIQGDQYFEILWI